MTEFNVDSIVCHVGRPNNRTEKHGDQDVLACDIPLRVMEPDEWSKLTGCIWSEPSDDDERVVENRQKAADTLHSLDAMKFASLVFDTDGSVHTVNFRRGTKKLVTLTEAKVNKVRLEFGENLGLTFRVQACVSTEQYQTLQELWLEKAKLRIEVKCTGEDADESAEEQLELGEE